MDDTKDKIRRNLVVFCIAIIGAEYLSVKPSAIVSALISDKLEIKNIERAWNVAAIMFLYFIYRFSGLQETKDHYTKIKDQFFQAIESGLIKFYLEEIKTDFVKNKISSDHITHVDKVTYPLLPPDLLIVNLHLQSHEDDVPSGLFWRLVAQCKYYAYIALNPIPGDSNNGQLMQKLEGKITLAYSSPQPTVKIILKLRPSIFHNLNIVRKASFAAFFSWAGTEVIFPVILSAIASVIIFLHLPFKF